MDLMEKIGVAKRQEDRRHSALSAAHALVRMDPHAREDMICYLTQFNEAAAAGDLETQTYLMKAILEVLEAPEVESESDLDEWHAETRGTTEGRAAAGRLREETSRFFEAYQQCKDKSGLTTIRAIARAAGLSPTTVQAIENEKVKPQYKTIRALAKAFKVRPEALAGPGTTGSRHRRTPERLSGPKRRLLKV